MMIRRYTATSYRASGKYESGEQDGIVGEPISRACYV